LTGIARFKHDLGEAWVCHIFAKEILSRSSAFEQNARTSNVTNKQTTERVTSIAINKIACQLCCLIINNNVDDYDLSNG